jgi:hypothetical protein
MLPNANSVRELLEIVFGVAIITTPTESDVTVGTAAVKLGTQANTRVAIAISNAGAATISIGFSNQVTATTGIQVASGGSLFLDWRTDGELVTSDLYTISASSGNSVHVVEYKLAGL